MTKTIVSIAVAVLALAAGGYFVVTRTEVTTVQPTAQPQASANEPPQRPKPEHGDFEKRFAPKPPPANGGKF